MRPRVLVVDDDRDRSTPSSTSVGREGYDVVARRTPAEALSTLETADPAVVLTDLRMEGTDGFEVLVRSDGARRPPGSSS